MKKGWTVAALAAFLLIIIISGSFYTVAENEHACIVRFSKIEHVESKAGLHFKIPFIDSVMKFPKTILLYDITESDVLTLDKKSMKVDSYIIWEITNPLEFYQKLGTIKEAEIRLDATTYNSLKMLMGRLDQKDIINLNESSNRNDIYDVITKEVAEDAKNFGIRVIDVKVRRLDLPEDNEQAVYSRMISDRNQIAEKHTADGQFDASIIHNDVDRQVNIIKSNAQAEAAKIEADGEAEYMRMLAEAYDTADKKGFYEFIKALDALKASLNGSGKTVILGRDSALGRLLLDPLAD